METYMTEIKELKFSYGFKKPDIFGGTEKVPL